MLRAVLAILLCTLVVKLFDFSAPERHLDDFIIYWAAGRLNARGANPYSADAVLAEQRTAGWTGPFPYRVLYPPWSVAVMTPFAQPPYQWGRFLWFLLHIGIVVWAVDALWCVYGNARSPYRVGAQILAVTFWPTEIVWKTGQAGPLLLLGLVAFLVCERRGWLVAAGAALSLAALKPQVPVLLWPFLVPWVLAGRRWPVLLGFGGSMTLLTAAAVATNPAVVAQFVEMLRHDPPYNEPSTLGTALRLALKSGALAGASAAQLAPLACGLLWVGWYWWRHRERWDWTERLPLVCVVSLLTTPWCWVYDEVILLIPLIQVAAVFEQSPWTRRRSLAVAGYVVAGVAILAMNVTDARAFDYIWTMPVFFALYLLAAAARPTWPPPIGEENPTGSSVFSMGRGRASHRGSRSRF
jgi:glycosyl transferase family 87